MTPKTAALEIPELMQFLRQQLHDLPDERKPGNNTISGRRRSDGSIFNLFYTVSVFFRSAKINEKQ
jgi:hypothetical protein